MFVNYMFCDDEKRLPPSQDPNAGITFAPSLDAIETAVRSLDGDTVRLIVLAEAPPNDKSYFPFGGKGMMIGGGGHNGLYVCQVGGMDRDTVYFLTGPEHEGLESRTIMFGQLSHFDNMFCIDLATVLHAARKFAETGHLDDGLTWVMRTA